MKSVLWPYRSVTAIGDIFFIRLAAGMLVNVAAVK
jgi:hypothetical protein